MRKGDVRRNSTIETQKKVAVLDHERQSTVKRVGRLSEAKVYHGFFTGQIPGERHCDREEASPEAWQSRHAS